MPFSIYNTADRKVEELIFNDQNSVNTPGKASRPVRIYSCGPTVYDRAHIGNFRTYIFTDLLRRSLIYCGYSVDQVVNLTDIDDKTIQSVLKINSEAGIDDLRIYTQEYIDEFFNDLEKLRISRVEHYPRATDYIDSMLRLIEQLDNNGKIYRQDGSVYFKISAFSEYGHLSGLDPAGIRSTGGNDSDEYTKDDVRDFVLWKGEKKEGNIGWNSSYGFGRPGWHLECSAMIESIFSGPIDIHTGGVDLIFPHHENEIAQSRCAWKHEFVRYWVHCEHLLVDGKKMSKSAGNFYTLQNLLELGYPAPAVRYLLLSVHYRQKLNFTFLALKQAVTVIENLKNFKLRLNESRVDESISATAVSEIKNFQLKFREALQDDLNISLALAVMHESAGFIHKFLDNSDEKLNSGTKDLFEDWVAELDSVLAIFPENAVQQIPAEVTSLLILRNRARADKNYKEADNLRDQIRSSGFDILDTPLGPKLRSRQA